MSGDILKLVTHLERLLEINKAHDSKVPVANVIITLTSKLAEASTKYKVPGDNCQIYRNSQNFK